MPSLSRLVHLVLHGPGHPGLWTEPPSPSARGAGNIAEVSQEGLSVAITWEPARSRKQGSHTYRVSVTRWYQDREGAWRNTGSLHADDLPKIPDLVTECIAKVQ